MVTQTNISAATAPRATHLGDLRIQGFRGIRDLAIDRLGQVTLIAGMNGVGKTTVLDAVRLYANRGSSATLIELLEGRDELQEYQDDDGDSVAALHWASLFHGRQMDIDSKIAIGPNSADSQLLMCLRRPNEDELKRIYAGPDSSLDDDPWMLSAKLGVHEHATFMSPRRPRRAPLPKWRDRVRQSKVSDVTCVSIGPGLLTNRQTQTLWSSVALTDAEEEAVEALNLVVGIYGAIERVAFVGDDRLAPTRAIVRRAGEDEPVPLKSLGDGAVRILGLALTLTNSKGGFLLIDEVENGLHFSVQELFWKLVMRSARANDVQVIATTHSWDVVAGYARAASSDDAVDGRLIRIERRGEKMRAVEYKEDELLRVALTGSEVR